MVDYGVYLLHNPGKINNESFDFMSKNLHFPILLEKEIKSLAWLSIKTLKYDHN